MNEEELRIKLLRIAQSYKEERRRNIEFEAALQKTYKELLEVKGLQKEFDQLQVEHVTKNKDLLKMQKEISRYKLYQDTISKQEQVIHKLEQNLEKCILRSEKYEGLIKNISKIEKENKEIQNQIEKECKNFDSSEDVNQMKDEISKL